MFPSETTRSVERWRTNAARGVGGASHPVPRHRDNGSARRELVNASAAGVGSTRSVAAIRTIGRTKPERSSAGHSVIRSTGVSIGPRILSTPHAIVLLAKSDAWIGISPIPSGTYELIPVTPPAPGLAKMNAWRVELRSLSRG